MTKLDDFHFLLMWSIEVLFALRCTLHYWHLPSLHYPLDDGHTLATTTTTVIVDHLWWWYNGTQLDDDRLWRRQPWPQMMWHIVWARYVFFSHLFLFTNIYIIASSTTTTYFQLIPPIFNPRCPFSIYAAHFQIIPPIFNLRCAFSIYAAHFWLIPPIFNLWSPFSIYADHFRLIQPIFDVRCPFSMYAADFQLIPPIFNPRYH
jgi:hypothetical protein